MVWEHTVHRIRVLCPENKRPSGGVRRLYHWTDVLGAAGYDSAIVHSDRSFRCTWFEHSTPIVGFREETLTADDLLIVPELYGRYLKHIAPGIPKLIANQNAFYTFRGVNGNEPAPLYDSRDIVGLFTVSEHSQNVLNTAFPDLPVERLHYSIDADKFAPGEEKKRRVVYMPRKRREDALLVFALARQMNMPRHWDIMPLENLTELQTAGILADSWIFLSMSKQEGFGLPPAEAMASGCIVAGFDGFGGREFFDPAWCFPAAEGDVLAAAEGLVRAARMVDDTPAAAKALSERAAREIRKRYSYRQESEDLFRIVDNALDRAARFSPADSVVDIPTPSGTRSRPPHSRFERLVNKLMVK